MFIYMLYVLFVEEGNVNMYLLMMVQAFGWAYVNNWHNTWEQFYVYWICPFIGAVLAAWIFRIVFPAPAPVKQKKA